MTKQQQQTCVAFAFRQTAVITVCGTIQTQLRANKLHSMRSFYKQYEIQQSCFQGSEQPAALPVRVSFENLHFDVPRSTLDLRPISGHIVCNTYVVLCSGAMLLYVVSMYACHIVLSFDHPYIMMH